MVGMLVSDNLSAYMDYMNQFEETRLKYTFVAPNEFNDSLSMLLIPSLNVFSGYESYIRLLGSGGKYPDKIDVFGRSFFENTIERYIKAEIPILAVGNSADMLWVALGGDLELCYEEPESAAIIGLHGQSELSKVTPKLGSQFSFHHSAKFEESYFNLVKRPTTVFPIGWKAWINRSVYLSQLKTELQISDYIADNGLPVAAFEHVSGKFFGIKENPTLLSHRFGSEIRRRYGLTYGSAITAAMFKFLFNGGPAIPTAEVLVPTR